MTLHELTGHLAQDLRTQHWDSQQLLEVCEEELAGDDLSYLDITPEELSNKVQRAYISMLRDGFKRKEE